MSLNSFKKKISSGPVAIGLFTLVVLCVGVLAFTGIGQTVGSNKDNDSSTRPPAEVVAKVDGKPITVAEYQSALASAKEEYEGDGQPSSVASAPELRVAAFNNLIEPILFAQLATEHGLTVSDDELQAARNKVLARYKSELGLPATASDSDMNNALQGQNITVDDLVDTNQIKVDTLASKYGEFLTEANQASEDQVKKYYQQSRVRYILISNKTKPDAQALALASDLISRLKKGANFALLAKQYSDDSSNKDKGGELGMVGQSSSYALEFKNAALALAAGQTTATPVLSPQFGYFIIQAEAVNADLPKDYQKNHEQYVTNVSQALARQQEQTGLAAEKAKASIVLTDPRLRADVAVSNAQGPAGLQPALADYNTALGNADDSDKAEIYASEAQIYDVLGQPDKEVIALNSALSSTEDPTLRVKLGDLYRQKGDSTDALKQYETASQNSYDNPNLHVQLMQDFRTLKQPQLVKAESDWLKLYYARLKQANAQQPGGPTPSQ